MLRSCMKRQDPEQRSQAYAHIARILLRSLEDLLDLARSSSEQQLCRTAVAQIILLLLLPGDRYIVLSSPGRCLLHSLLLK